MTETHIVDVLPEQSRADRAWPWAERHGMERELYYALAEPWVTNTTTRLLGALLNSKITTRAQIMDLGVDGLSRVRNLGTKGIAFIRQRLNEAATPMATENGRSLGARIASLRRRRGLKQTELAECAKLSATFLSELENGHRSIGVESLDRVASALGASIDYLVRGAEPLAIRRSLSESLNDIALRVRDIECGWPVDRITGKPITQANLDAMYDMMDELAVRGEQKSKELDRLLSV